MQKLKTQNCYENAQKREQKINSFDFPRHHRPHERPSNRIMQKFFPMIFDCSLFLSLYSLSRTFIGGGECWNDVEEVAVHRRRLMALALDKKHPRKKEEQEKIKHLSYLSYH